MRTLATYIAVGQELARFGVVKLFGGLLYELAVVVETAEIVGCKLMVNSTCCARIDIKRDTKIRKRTLDKFVITVHHLLCGYPLFAGTDSNRHTVFITSANKKYILTAKTKIPSNCIFIRRPV